MNIVVVGSGIAGVTLAEEVRKRMAQGHVTILTQETHGYYSRPMLSHGFSRADVEQKILLRSFDTLRSAGIEVIDGAEVSQVFRDDRTVSYRTGAKEQTIPYDTLVFAVGSDALIPPPFREHRARFRVLNSLDDLLALRRRRTEVLETGARPHWAIIGGGLIGCELASDLAAVSDRVTIFHALPRLMERQLVEEDSANLASVLEGAGVELRLDAAVTGFTSGNAPARVVLASGVDPTPFDSIIVACGFKPRVALAQSAALPVNRGIRVDARLRTEDPCVCAIGDVAEFDDGRLYAYVLPIRSQALWLAESLTGGDNTVWTPPFFKPKAKVHGFTAAHPYLF